MPGAAASCETSQSTLHLFRGDAQHTGGNQHRAARVLGVARHTLRTKRRDLGLRVTHAVEGDEPPAIGSAIVPANRAWR